MLFFWNLYMYIIYFEHIHTSFPSLQMILVPPHYLPTSFISSTFILLITLWVHFVLPTGIWLCFIHWGMDNLSRHFPEGKWLYSPVTIIFTSSTNKYGVLEAFFPLVLEFWLAPHCAGNHSYREFMGARALCLEACISQQSSSSITALISFLLCLSRCSVSLGWWKINKNDSSCLDGGRLIKMSHPQQSTHSYLSLALWQVMGLSTNYYPLQLQKEASLTKIANKLNLWA